MNQVLAMKKACIAVHLAIAATLLAAEPKETFTVDRFTFAVPEGWKKVAPPSPMRKAQLEIGEGTLKAEVTFFHFGGGSGSTADNVSRWFSQFSGSEANRKTENTEVNGVKITFVETAGTFSSGMPGGPTTPLPIRAPRRDFGKHERRRRLRQDDGSRNRRESCDPGLQRDGQGAAQPAGR